MRRSSIKKEFLEVGIEPTTSQLESNHDHLLVKCRSCELPIESYLPDVLQGHDEAADHDQDQDDRFEVFVLDQPEAKH